MFGRAKNADWEYEIPGSALRYRFARPSGMETDKPFHCGDEDWSREINDYVNSQRWAGNELVTPLEFGLDGQSVGFAFVVRSKKGFPTNAGPDKAHYQYITYLGINTGFQRGEDPTSGLRFSKLMFHVIEGLPREVLKNREVVGQVVGLMLEVAVDNIKAIRCYERNGFQRDESRPPFQSSAGIFSIHMRKLFE